MAKHIGVTVAPPPATPSTNPLRDTVAQDIYTAAKIQAINTSGSNLPFDSLPLVEQQFYRDMADRLIETMAGALDLGGSFFVPKSVEPLVLASFLQRMLTPERWQALVVCLLDMRMREW